MSTTEENETDRSAFDEAMTEFINDAPMHPDRESGFIAGWWRAIAWERNRVADQPSVERNINPVNKKA